MDSERQLQVSYPSGRTNDICSIAPNSQPHESDGSGQRTERSVMIIQTMMMMMMMDYHSAGLLYSTSQRKQHLSSGARIPVCVLYPSKPANQDSSERGGRAGEIQ